MIIGITFQTVGTQKLPYNVEQNYFKILMKIVPQNKWNFIFSVIVFKGPKLDYIYNFSRKLKKKN